MSSRALRKLQKQRELEAQVQFEKDQESSNDEDAKVAAPKAKLNAFDLLNAATAAEDDEEEDDEDDEKGLEYESKAETQHKPLASVSTSNTKEASKKKKKKKKKQKRETTAPRPVSEAEKVAAEEELDDIDRALRDLSVKNGAYATSSEQHKPAVSDQGNLFAKSPEELLAIEPKSLNAINEMRKLFGNVVLESFEEQETAGSGRRRERQREMIDLGKALSGRYSPASRGQSLAGVTLRKNILMQGKDEWPRTTSGGLGMELVEKLANGNSLYRLVHNKAYEDIQMQFEMCVESMDPQRLIHLLQYNPYHLSTLLQVSEIAKHQSDHAVSADLLERALFNIGRSAHSSFGAQLQAGKAKLDFMQTENRELWLTVWRYIANLGMKGTWRTAYEWAKLLLSLDTDDPYCMRLVIDHLALRGRQYEHFISLCTETVFREDWASYPNIQCSLSLAYLRLNKPKEARQQLRLAMSRYSWIFSRLAQELDLQPIPKRIWGKMPPAQSHELLTELYVSRAKDLWNTPEVVSLLVEIAETLSDKEEPLEPPEISLDIARHVVLSDIPRVTTHLPTRFTTGRISASDPLPPYESEAHRQQSDPVPSYISRVPDLLQPQWLRDLLGRMNIDVEGLHAAEHDLADDEEAEANEGTPDLGSIDGENTRDSSTPPSSDNQEALRQWLLGAGVLHLRSFLFHHGVDRGNWGEGVDDESLRNYIEGLMRIDPWEDREDLLYGPIQDLVGEMVVDLLESECQMHPDY
ncbi:hypothetical protein UA08_05631 [Talaromyces atroroseus]|uniref:Ribosome quality control complex subunit 1 n=1 Tax=Talaromyces atroroseus TaxID=1441469 RepID=A0A225AKI3_TALAT|nr:hypothetical protein UA08_05631 [Talaromyces atroroseus]OKL58814.1 hypothetical protein UA08_05631 [Talaromyces atroroseus]